MEEYLSIKEFASLMKLHSSTIRRAIKSGRLQFVRIGIGKKSAYRIPRSEISRLSLFDLEEMVTKIIEQKKMDTRL